MTTVTEATANSVDVQADYPGLQHLLFWVEQREAIRKRREAGEPHLTDDPLLAKYRFCNLDVQHDRVSRAIFDLVTQPYAAHPHLILALTVCRFTNEPEVIRRCVVVSCRSTRSGSPTSCSTAKRAGYRSKGGPTSSPEEEG